MGKIHDTVELQAYRHVLTALAHVVGYIQWKQLPNDWLHKHLPGYTQRAINGILADHARHGGEVHQVVEKRPEYTEYRFHYDIRLPISGRRIYIETVFIHERDPEDCCITIVNMHDA